MESDTGKDLGREEQYCGITLSPSGADYRGAEHRKTAAGMGRWDAGSRSGDLLFSRRRGECAHADTDVFYVILVISGQITSLLAQH